MRPRGLAERRRADLAAARRARVLGVLLLTGLTAVTVAGLSWAWRSGVLDTRTQVVGHERTPLAAIDEQVAELAAAPLPLVDTREVERRVARLHPVLSVRAERRWPRTLVVRLTERQPAAAVAPPDSPTEPDGPVAGGGSGPAGTALTLVDPEGVVLDSLPPGSASPDVPIVVVDLGADDAVARLRAALAAEGALSARLREATTRIEARSAHDVRLVVEGREVRWGGSEAGADKAAVLELLLTRSEAPVLDVSAPAAPATSG